MEYSYDGNVNGFVHFKSGMLRKMYRSLKKKVEPHGVTFDIVRAYEMKEFFKDASGTWHPATVAPYSQLAFTMFSRERAAQAWHMFTWNYSVNDNGTGSNYVCIAGSKVPYDQFMAMDELRLAMMFTITEDDKKRLEWV